MADLEMWIDEDGNVQHVYDDALAPIAEALGDTSVRRASHVEPHPSRPGWVADMRPVGGPILGRGGEWRPQSPLPMEYMGDLERHFTGMLDPFTSRAEALAAERTWLDAALAVGRVEAR